MVGLFYCYLCRPLKVKVDTPDKHGNTALIRAVRFPAVVKTLLAHKASVGRANSSGESARTKLANLIDVDVDVNADVDVDVVVCCCLLLFVVVCCCLLLFVVVCCCSHTHWIYFVSTGDTALHIAAEEGNEEVCKLLLDAGASGTATNKEVCCCLTQFCASTTINVTIVCPQGKTPKDLGGDALLHLFK